MGKTTDCKHGIDVYEFTCYTCETNSAKIEALEDLKLWILEHEEYNMSRFTVNLITTEIDRRIKKISEDNERKGGK